MQKFNAYGPSIIVLLTALVVLLAGPRAIKQLRHANEVTRVEQATLRLEGNTILEQLNDAYRDIATIVSPSVVHISTTYEIITHTHQAVMRNSSGSGWIYDTEGHIVTNHHVIEGAQRIQVQLHDGELREAVLVNSDPRTDIAVLKIDSDGLIPAQRPAVVSPVDQGDLVFAFGSPFEFRFSMSAGVVSGMGRWVGVIRNRSNQPVGYENFIQVDAAINPGNSGGPLTNVNGEIIGMNTAIATGRAGFEEGQFAGIGLAIPMEMIEPVVSQIIEKGFVEKGYLGVDPGNLETSDRLDPRLQQLGMPNEGVRVDEVFTTGPAYEAGVKRGDIITHVNDIEVRSDEQLRSVVSSMLPGEIVSLRIWRRVSADQATTTEVQLELGRHPGLN